MSTIMMSGIQSHTDQTGVIKLNENDVRSIYNIDKSIDNETGIPSPLAKDSLYSYIIKSDDLFPYSYQQPTQTGFRTVKTDYSIKDVHLILLKALFYNQFTYKTINYQELGSLGRILSRIVTGGDERFDFTIFSIGDKPYAYSAPKCLILPVPDLTDVDLDNLLQRFSSIGGQNNAATDAMFIKWAKTMFPDHVLLKDKTSTVKEQDYQSALGFAFSAWVKSADTYELKDIKTYQGAAIKCNGCGKELSVRGGEVYINEERYIPLCACYTPLPLPEHLGEIGLFFDKSRKSYYIWEDCDKLPENCVSRQIIDGGAVYQYGNLSVKVYGKVISTKDVFCSSVMRLKYGEDENPTSIFPDLPVKTDMLFCLYKDSAGNYEHERSIITQADCQWQIKLRGFANKCKVVPAVESIIEEANIFSFPSFESDGYKRCSVYCDPVFIGGTKLQKVRFVSKAEYKGNKAAESMIKRRTLEKGDSLTCNEGLAGFELQSTTGASFGYFSFNKQSINKDSGKSYKLGIDFGTTATAFAYQTDDNSPSQILFIKDLTYWFDKKTGIYSDNWIKDFNKNCGWIPAFGHEDTASLRSELAVNQTVLDSIDTLFNSIKNNSTNLNKTVNELRLSKYNLPDTDYVQVNVEGQQLSWNDLAQDFKWSTDSSNKGYVYTMLYLEYALDMAIASLISQTQCVPGTINIKATYPLAFRTTQNNYYKEILTTVARALSASTGINIQVEQDLVSESMAGVYDCGSDCQVGCSVDLGGKTTDISIFDHAQHISLLDSIRYGGTDFIKIMLAESLYPKHAESMYYGSGIYQDNKTENIQTEILRSLFRRNSEVIDRMFSSQEYANSSQLLRTMTSLFFDGLLLYLKKLIDASIKSEKIKENKKITFYLLGNGWGMLRGVGSLENNGHTLHSLINEKMEDLNPNWTFEVKAPDGMPKHAVSKGMLNAVGTLRDADKVKTFSGMDATISYRNNPSKQDTIAWNSDIPHPFEQGTRPEDIIISPKSPDLELHSFDHLNERLTKSHVLDRLNLSTMLTTNAANNAILSGSILGKYMSEAYLPWLQDYAKSV